MLIGEIIEKAAWAYPDKEAFVGNGLRLTFAETNKRINRLANGLLDIGMNKGDKIALFAKNSVQFMELYFAIGKIGGVTVPVNCRLTADELAYIIQDAGVKALFYEEEFSSQVNALGTQLSDVPLKIVIDSKIDGSLSFEALLDKGTPERPMVQLSPDDLAILFYTSGTTGKPKGVIWSHRTVHYNCFHACTGWNLNSSVTMLVVLPLFHQVGAHTIANVYAGAKSVILPKFEIIDLLKVIEKERITRVIMVPTTIVMMIEHPDCNKYDLSSLQNIQYGGSPMPVMPLEKAIKVLGCSFSQSYGMTEAPLLTRLAPDDHLSTSATFQQKRLYSVGRPMPDVIGIKIVDNHGNELPAGTDGEIIAKMPGQMSGYWNLPEETEKALKGGWLHTGDMGYLDEDGYLYLTDRKKDVIITGGVNVSSKEVEEVLYGHPSIYEAAVIGVPHELWGEAVKAVVVLKPGMQADEQELMAHCRERLAGYKCPKSVDFVGCLPKSSVGKILKREIREKYYSENCGKGGGATC